MTIWTPRLDPNQRPRYVAIADALANDIATGNLTAGTRLPTHRDLAYRLRLNVGTVSRAYREAERRGLIAGEVGRGTFVQEGKHRQSLFRSPDRRTAEFIDLAANRPVLSEIPAVLAAGLQDMSRDPAITMLVDYVGAAGLDEHRAAGTIWLERFGLTVTPDQVIVCSGAQHAILTAFATLLNPGDVLLTEALTFPGALAAAKAVNLRVQGLAIDEEGLVPEALETACRKGHAKALYCVPTLQNPTAAVMSESRRREIAAIAEAHDLLIIEDDVYGFLIDAMPPPITSLIPEQSLYLTSMSKCLAPGLRVGYIATPRHLVDAVALGSQSSIWMAPPVMAQLVTHWIADGTADRMAGFQQREARARQQMLRRQLSGHAIETNPESMHALLHLPEPWRAADFVRQARQHGVLVTPAEAFAAGQLHAPHAVRICLGGPRSRDELARGLATILTLLSASPAPDLTVV